MRRRSKILPLLSVAFGLSVPLAGASSPTSFELLGVAEIAAGAEVDGAPVGGLSGLVWDAASGDFWAISDDRSEEAPARVFRLGIELKNGKLEAGGVSARAMTTLRTKTGAPYPPRSLDPEGLALTPGAMFVASEGDAKKGIAPFVAEFGRDGSFRREVGLPARYLPRRGAPEGGAAHGVRDNLGFESLALSPDGRHLFAGLENALAQDGPAAAPGVPSLARILRWDLTRGGAAQEFLYRVEAVNITPPSPTDFLVNGLVDLVALDDSNLLALERQWVPGAGLSVRLYAASLDGLTDAARLEAPAIATLATAKKTLLFDFARLGVRLDNFEGMAFGPPLADGRRSFFVVSDDNFNREEQKTFVLAFGVGFEPLSIAAVQGAAHRSPFEKRFVAGLEGIVTATEDAKNSRGFWLESERADADPATSEAIYVSWEGASTLRAGQRVRVGGRVEERARDQGLPVTTLDLVALEGLAEGVSLAAAPRLGRELRIPELVDDDGLARFEPAGDAIDFWESLESMRVEVPAGTVIGPTRSFGDVALLPDGADVELRTPRGGIVFMPERYELDRLIVGRRISGSMPDLAVGERVGESFTGLVDYSFSNYKILPLAPLAPLAVPAGPACGERTSLTSIPGALTVATFNVENLSVANGSERLPEIARVIVGELGAPAILALEELQDDSGPVDDGVVTSRATAEALVAALVAAGGPRYEAAWIDPENNRDGGQPAGNIRVALFSDPRRAQLVRRGAAGPRDATEIEGRGGDVRLSLSPGRIAPTSPAFDLGEGEGVRKSLAAEFRVGSRKIFVVANHFSSKWEDDRLLGARQPPMRPTGARRLAQARELRAFAEKLLAADPQARLVILGDLNEPEWAEGVADLSRPPLENLTLTLPPGERYTYNFEGSSQAIDHVIVSPALAAAAELDIVHRNSDCPDRLRVSDHDPVVVRFRLR